MLRLRAQEVGVREGQGMRYDGKLKHAHPPKGMYALLRGRIRAIVISAEFCYIGTMETPPRLGAGLRQERWRSGRHKMELLHPPPPFELNV